MSSKLLYYIHDPMCSWCWAFRPVWDQIKANLPADMSVAGVLGGLAPDTDQPMPIDLQHKIQSIWKTIQHTVPSTEFNFDFWTDCKPRRATYSACRAVIAAMQQGAEFEEPMNHAIQKAYYLHAQNPSDQPTLIDLAGQIGLDSVKFKQDLTTAETHNELIRQIDFSRKLGAQGFPSLVLQSGNQYHALQLDYLHPEIVLRQIGRMR